MPKRRAEVVSGVAVGAGGAFVGFGVATMAGVGVGVRVPSVRMLATMSSVVGWGVGVGRMNGSVETAVSRPPPHPNRNKLMMLKHSHQARQLYLGPFERQLLESGTKMSAMIGWLVYSSSKAVPKSISSSRVKPVTDLDASSFSPLLSVMVIGHLDHDKLLPQYRHLHSA